MNVQAEARVATAPERVYSLAAVLNPKTNRSIRRDSMAALLFAIIALAALLLLL